MNRFTKTLAYLKGQLWDHKWRRRATIALGLLVALLFVAWFAFELFLIPKAARRVEQELATLGIHISYQDPDLSLWRGSLTLSNVILYETAQKDEPLLSVSDFGVRLDLGELIWQQALWGEGSIEDGLIVVYGKDRDLQFKDFTADIEIDSDELRVLHCSSTTNIGYHLNLTGIVRWGSAPAAQPPAAAEASPVSPATTHRTQTPTKEASDELPNFPGDLIWLEEVAEILICEPQGDQLATLELELTWDETRSPTKRADGSPVTNHQLSLSGRVSGQDIVWQKFPLHSLSASIDIEDWQVNVPESKFVGLDGEANISGTYDLETHRLAVDKLTSTMDPIEVIERLDPSFAEPLKGIGYEQNPLFEGEEFMIDFQDLRASEIVIRLEAPRGIHYREAPDDDEVLALVPLSAIIAYGNAPELRIRDLETRINGLDVKATVTLQKSHDSPATNPTTEDTAPPAASSAGSSTMPIASDGGDGSSADCFSLVRALNNLLLVEYDHAPAPQLEVEIVSGPPESADKLQISGKFSGSNFSWHGRAVESASMDFGFGGSQLDIGRIRFAGLGGELEATGSYDLDGKILMIPSLISTIDIGVMQEKLEIELPEPLDTIAFPAPPRITIDELELHLGESPTGHGRIEFTADQGFVVSEGNDTLTAERFSIAMAWNEPQCLTIEGATGRLEDLEFNLGGSLRWRKPSLSQESKITPDSVDADQIPQTASSAQAPPPTSATAPEPSDLARVMKFLTVSAATKPVLLEGQFDWDETKLAPDESGEDAWKKQLQMDATVSGKNFSWLDFSVMSSDGRIRLQDGVLHFLPFQLETTEGSIESRATFEIGRKRLRMATLRLTMDPVVVLKRFDLLVGDADWIDFLGSPVITGMDVFLDFNDMTNSSGELRKLDRAGIALTPPSGRKGILEDVRGTLIIDRGVFSAKNVSAKFLGGDARLDFELSPLGKTPSYATAVAINNISLDALNDWLDPANRVIEKGNFNLSFKGAGSDSLESLAGDGLVTIDADSGAAQDFPFVSGLVGFLEGLFPVLSRNRHWELDLPFSVAAGKIESTAGRLTARRVSARLSGSVDWVNDRVEILAGVNLSGLVGIVTSIATPLRENFIEVAGRGTFDKIEWGRRRSLDQRENRKAQEAEKSPSRRPEKLRRKR